MEELKLEDEPEFYGNVSFKEIHIITTNKLLNSLMPSLLKKYECNFKHPDCNSWHIKEHNPEIINFLMDKHDIYPSLCMYVNRETEETYKILNFRCD